MKSPDRKAPRCRETYKTLLNSDLLKAFKKKYPEYTELSLQDFKEIIMAFNHNIAEGVIENRNGVELPEGLGFIFMGTCQPAKKKNIDYKKSIEFGVEVIYRNWDSDNHLLKIFYTNYSSRYPFKNKEVWVFKAVRQFRVAASHAYRDNWAKYIKVDPDKKVTALFKQNLKKQYGKTLKLIIPEEYDEFKM